MNPRRSKHWIIWVMGGSLALLLVLEVYWLREEYLREREEIWIEADRSFLDVVRNIQDSIIQNILILPFPKNSSDRLKQYQRDSVFLPADSSNAKVFFAMDLALKLNEKIQRPTWDSLSVNTIAAKNQVGKTGMISIFVETTDSDSLKYSELDQKLIDLLETHLIRDTLISEKLDIVNLRKDSIQFTGRFTQSYEDMATGGKYAAIVTTPPSKVMLRMFPQLFFSLLVFASVILAFGIALNNVHQQRRLSRLQDDFISNITHELKTPLTTVGVALEALKSFPVRRDPERVREYLDISRQEVERLSGLVNRILNFASVTENGLALNYESLDFPSLTEEVLGTFSPQLEAIHGEVTWDRKKDSPNFPGDRTHIKNVIYNLIENAIKYSVEQVTLQIQTGSNSRNCWLSIQDSGMGIPEPYQHRIFEKFFRIPDDKDLGIPGHGLGLSYVWQVVEAHKGKIEVSSQPGKGTTFTLILPRSDD
ncbi:MAG: HAMP domain-containing sensor histidine kinase [Bacteroidota bacterium]